MVNGMAFVSGRGQAWRVCAGLAAQPRSLPYFCRRRGRGASRAAQFLYDMPHSGARTHRDDAPSGSQPA
ncbi:conserved hypothetical protein [Cupriavidus taiwanensis]|nr:conserved hypothetical protein [Cupriavidus taiwanensis]SOZ86524.1 conserved hypothetical protein [Cupriavidus taiwanensis]SOZ89803.1 conserved hypothetical protein [Cupriavidus taiwanensis]SPA32352.1 conserved hypothetical protein [Cupriavidus taiwanensis]